jgi:hypothetical protein
MRQNRKTARRVAHAMQYGTYAVVAWAATSVRVLGQHASSGRSRTHNLDVVPSRPRIEHGDVRVTRGSCDRTREGDTVRVHLRPGALGARWFDIRDCE